MKRLPLPILFLGVLLAACTAPPETVKAVSKPSSEEVIKPFLPPSGQAFRVAVVQSGDYFAYNDVLVSIRGGLADLGWTTAMVLSPAAKASIPIGTEKGCGDPKCTIRPIRFTASWAPSMREVLAGLSNIGTAGRQVPV